MIDFGTPCNLQISIEKRLANWVALKEVGRAMKWADLDSLSQTTHMTVWPKDEGKWVIKFVVNSSQSLAGMGIGWSNPEGFLLLDCFVDREDTP